MDVTRYIFAYDPGLTTGWAVMDTVADRVTAGEDDFDTFCERADTWLEAWVANVSVVGERFVINVQTAKHSQAPWSLEAQGVVRYLTRKHLCGEVTLQSPADAKRLVTNEHIRALGWWTPGTRGHDRDALRHLALFALRRGWRHPVFVPE